MKKFRAGQFIVVKENPIRGYMYSRPGTIWKVVNFKAKNFYELGIENKAIYNDDDPIHMHSGDAILVELTSLEKLIHFKEDL